MILRPLVVLAAALALGVAAGDALHVVPLLYLGLAGATCMAAVLCCAFSKDIYKTFFLAALAVMFAGAGYTRARAADIAGRALNPLLTEEPRLLQVRGRVDSRPENWLPAPWRAGDPERSGTQFDLRVTHLRIAGRWQALPGLLRVTVDNPAPALQYGDEIETVLLAHRVAAPGNPGEYDYARRLERYGFSGAAFVRDAAGLHLTGRTFGLPGLRHVYHLKQRLLNFLSVRWPGPAGNILQCLLLGERDALSDAQQQAFQTTGTIHFFAISGLHVAILAATIAWVMVLLGVSVRASVIAVMIGVLLYGTLAGFQPSVLRSVLMCEAFCGAFLLRRKPDVASSLALSLIALLLIQPADLFSPGLQLSFIAVAGICLFAAPLERRLFGEPHPLDRLQAPELRSFWRSPFAQRVRTALCISLAAWGSTLPVVMYHFGTAAPLASLGSVLLLPPVWGAVVMGLPALLLGPLIGAWILAPAAFCAWLMDEGCALISRLPGVTCPVPLPTAPVLFIVAAVAVLLAFRKRLALRPPGSVALILAPVVVYLGIDWRAAAPEHLALHALDTGGNCILARFPDGQTLLFDAGGSNPEAGERIIAPALRALGVRRIDLAILSHGDSDHCNGILDLAARVPVARIAVTQEFGSSPEAQAVLDEFGRRGRIDFIAAGDRIEGFPAEIDILWPPQDIPSARFPVNDLSVVARIISPDGYVLLTGDFGHGAAGMLLRGHSDMRADVLQVPHHGLADPSAEALAAAIRPKLSIVPGRGDNPAVPVYNRYSRDLLATEESGMITVECSPGAPRTEIFRKRNENAD